AVHPARGLMYVASHEQPSLIAIVEPGAGRGAAPPAPDCGTGPFAGTPRGAQPGRGAAPAGRGGARGPAPALAAPAPQPDFVHYNSPINFMNSRCNGLELIGPPWSQLTAYDLNKGTIVWQVPDGEVTALARQGKTGLGSQAPRGGLVVTAGGLIFAGTSSDRKFRAYDQDTGKALWEMD